MSYSSMDSVEAVPRDERNSRRGDQLELTPEEIQVLKECSREGVFNRAIPLGVVFGVGGLMGAKSGLLMSSRFGVKPAVIGLGLIGYFVGRFSYSRICFDRALQVPNGGIRKYYEQRNASREFVDPSEKYYANIEPTYDAGYSSSSSRPDAPTTGIDDMAAVGSFDNTPSEYYKENVDAPVGDASQNYTSYDDLRRKNREEYSKRMYGDTVRRSSPQENIVRRPPPPQSQFPEQPGGIKTKYGDTWDA